ncbi:Type IVB pilus formation outer membrane protein,R64 PilN family [Candidatus Glomeribacter gigasporarum BEG34]|uniref:Type IVB pilus formation outer membrane protein,R64 PilN family n=1 Tax=Candidatus Glomeribacter gigasporarum BEG34 TaxID=1070319 RepID=G2J7P3_9BURK|nr:PilN family type IVB pilus formation outer membrane protein [Candidatus Glomeribacter gigasporarum]CCD28788.1 Type IVB pilus formation outer membrane protein,R64 PilN family [Candidatus Glomeribacter gigasporarum BEG34]
MRKVNGPFIVAAAALSAGCQSFQHARDIEQSALVEMDAARQQWHKHSAPRRAAQTVQYAAQQWIFPTPFTEAKAPPLGCELDIVSAEPVSLSEFSQLITRKCGMSVRLTRDALTAVSRPRASINMNRPPLPGAVEMQTPAPRAFDINHHGRLEALLDAVTARAGLAWQFDPDRRRVTIAALSSRTFPVHLIATDTDMKSEFHSGTTQVNGVLSAGSDSGQGGQGAAHTLQSTTVQLKTSLWKDIQHDIETIAPPPDNHISVSPATGSLTVAGAPDVLDRVQRYVDARNKQFDKFVTFQVHVVSVTISNTDAIGLRWSALYQTLAGKYGIELAQPFAAPASASAATFSILKTSVSPWAGTQAILHALNEQGHARLVRSTQLATMNLNPVATQTGAQEGYLASSNTTQTAQVGSTTTLSPGTINTGFNISMLPYVLEDNQILLRMNINLSSQKGPPRVIESGGARIELPSIALPLNTSNTIKVRAGDTVMLAAQEDIDDRAQRSGVGSSAFFALGGGVQAAQSRTLLVVLITPVLMQDSSHGRA